MISLEKSFRTKTLADVYAAQGKFGEAAIIYRELIAENPGDESLRQALTALDKGQYAESDVMSLENMVENWAQLILCREYRMKLRTLKKMNR